MHVLCVTVRLLPQILSDVCAQLARMHAAGYVHRDLKPTNIMWLPRQNRWTVIDFGCAVRIGGSTPVRVLLPYSSPEEVRAFEHGEPWLQATPALDAWAVGVMAFELLSGEPAFKASAGDRAKVRVHAPPCSHTCGHSSQRVGPSCTCVVHACDHTAPALCPPHTHNCGVRSPLPHRGGYRHAGRHTGQHIGQGVACTASVSKPRPP